MSFVAIDYVFGILVLILAIIGLMKGFVSEVFGKMSFVAGVLCGIFFYADISEKLISSVKNAVLSNILAFLIIFVSVFIVVKLIGVVVQKLFSISILKSLDHTLGLFFGIIEGLALVWGIIFILTTQTLADASGILNESFFYSLINQFLSTVAA